MIDFWHLIYRVYDPEYLKNAINTKASVVDKVFDSINMDPSSIYFPAYNPIIEVMADSYDVYLEPSCMVLAKNSRIKSAAPGQRYECVLALDEYLTYFADEDTQKQKLAELAAVCDGWLITTLVDYKNLAPYKKNQVEVLHDYRSDSIFFEQNSPDAANKQGWNSWFYCISDHRNLETLGPYPRRTMYFKQLAKYASDIGSTNYIVQKNTLYRGFGRKHWEHIITIRF
jgi:hypothetical protein